MQKETNMFQLPILRKFFSGSKGSISVEASIIFGLLIIFIFLIGEVGKNLINRSKADRLSYSLATIIRERSLYPNREISDNDAAGLYRIMQILQTDIFPQNSEVGLNIEALYFDPNIAQSPTIKLERNYVFGKNECSPSAPLSQFSNLSVKNTRNVYIALIRVTVCVSSQSIFLNTTNLMSALVPVQSSSIVLER